MCAFLNLGDCEFEIKKEANNVEWSRLQTKIFLQRICSSGRKFLNVDLDSLVKVLSYQSIKVRGVTSTIPLNPEKARATCDRLAMGIYSRMFDWLVKRINISLQRCE